MRRSLTFFKIFAAHPCKVKICPLSSVPLHPLSSSVLCPLSSSSVLSNTLPSRKHSFPIRYYTLSTMPFWENQTIFAAAHRARPGWLCDAVLSQLGEAHGKLARDAYLVRRSTPEYQLANWRLSYPASPRSRSASCSIPPPCAPRATPCAAACCFTPRPFSIRKNSASFAPLIATPRSHWPLSRGTAKRRAALVFLSSTAAQGRVKSAAQPLTEEMPCRPYSAYGKSKHEAELGLLKLAVPGSFDVVIVRPGPFYGTPVIAITSIVPALEIRTRAPGRRREIHAKLECGHGRREVEARSAVCIIRAPRAILICAATQICTQRGDTRSGRRGPANPAAFPPRPSVHATFFFNCPENWRQNSTVIPPPAALSGSNRHTGRSSLKAKSLLGFRR